MNHLTHVELLDAITEEAKSGKFEGPVYQYISSSCISAFQDDVNEFTACPLSWKYGGDALVLTGKGRTKLHYLKTRWSGGQAVALDIARTKIIPPEWNNIVKRVTITTEHIDQGKNVGSERVVEIRLRKDNEAIVITMSKNKIISTNHFYGNI